MCLQWCHVTEQIVHNDYPCFFCPPEIAPGADRRDLRGLFASSGRAMPAHGAETAAFTDLLSSQRYPPAWTGGRYGEKRSPGAAAPAPGQDG